MRVSNSICKIINRNFGTDVKIAVSYWGMCMDIKDRLFELADPKYRDFHSKLMPTVDKDRVIGVRMPALRKLAKELFDGSDEHPYLSCLPHYYYEENNLHALAVMQMKNFGAVLSAVDKFLPYVDNWATCDMFSPKIFGRNKAALLPKIDEWMASEHTYTRRFGIGMLMRHFLDENFSPKYLEKVAAVRSDEYYVNMMIGWYFATALAKQYDTVIPFLQERRLAPIPHNMAIKKAIESYRISPLQKQQLATLKIK